MKKENAFWLIAHIAAVRSFGTFLRLMLGPVIVGPVRQT